MVKLSLLGVTVLALAGSPLGAAEKMEGPATKPKKETTGTPPTKVEKAAPAVPFHGTLASKTDASITIKGRTFEVTSETKITKNDKPATLADGELGKEVSGQYLSHEGKLTAKSIRFGGKPDAPEKAKVEKVKKVKPEVKPEVKPAVKAEAPVK